MTVSRKESELVILRTIVDGDGEFVPIATETMRTDLILDDLLSAGHIRGVQLLAGGGQFRSTAKGERYLSQIEQELLDEETDVRIVPAETTAKRRPSLRLIAGSVVGLIGFVWLLLSEVLSPRVYCPYLPEKFSNILQPCEGVVSDNAE